MTNMTIEEIITEISISDDNLPWLIVEGTSDESFFDCLSINNDIKYHPAGGWENVVRIIHSCIDELKVDNVNGIIDRDYREALEIDKTCCGINIPINHIHQVDNIDLENLQFHDMNAFRNVMINYSKLKREELDDAFDRILKCSFPLSKFRYYSKRNNLEISLSKIEHDKFIDKDLNIDIKKFIGHVNGKNIGKKNITEDDWKFAQEEDIPEIIKPSRYFYNGHDLFCILGISLRKLFGKAQAKEVEEIAIQKYFRMSYDRGSFENTTLYQSLSRHIVI